MDEMKYNLDLLRAQNNQLASRIRLFEGIIDASSNAFLFYYIREDYFDYSSSFQTFFPGLSMDRWQAIDLFEQSVDESCREEFSRALRREHYPRTPDSVKISVNAGKHIYQVHFSEFLDEAGNPWVKFIKLSNVTVLNEKNQELEHLAYYDPLTELYNRNTFILRLSSWIERAAKENCVVSVASIDINDFRRINDGIGIMVGDELLFSFGRYINSLFEDKERYMCAHINADIYTIAIYDPMGEMTMDNVCRRIRKDLIEKPFDLSGEQVYITVKMGVAEYPEAASTAFELFERAEIVMFRVSHSDESWVRWFDDAAIKEFVQSTKIEQKLKAADFDKELLLYYQPQYYAKTGALRGAEALIRWKDASGKLVPPGMFIPVAERSRLIVDIGEWVMERAVTMLAKWQKKYGTKITISINISALHFAKDDFVDSVMNCLRRHNVPPHTLELEITETMIVDDFERIIEKLRILRTNGVQAALDDFGTGYSSFSYLRNLPLNLIKIDKAFVDAINNDDKGNILIGSIIDMMSRLGYETVAEGVEEHSQYDQLREMGCTYIQGYLLSKPLPEAEFESLLEDQVWE